MICTITLLGLYVKMVDHVLAQVMGYGMLLPMRGRSPGSALSIHEIRQLRIPDHPSASLPPFNNPETILLLWKRARHRSDDVLVGSAARSSSPLLSSKSTMPPDGPGPPKSLRCSLGAETTDFTRPPGRGPKLILSGSRHDASSAS